MKFLFPSKNVKWRIDTNKKEIFLTFDDGPGPSTTEYILECLNKHDVKATFFCIGKNVERHHLLYDAILKQGHVVGNHTYSHLSGWQNSLQDYVNDVKLAEQFINSNLFRPPYGQITYNQIKILQKSYKIFFWSVLTWDFKQNLNPQRCMENSIIKTQTGDIVVFHDSKKAFNRVEVTLPVFLSYFKDLGYCFGIIK